MSAQVDEAPVCLRVLSEIQRAHDRTRDEFNAMPLPTMEELNHALRTNSWLAAVVYRSAAHLHEGFRGSDMIVPQILGETEYGGQIDARDYDGLIEVIPLLRRMGFTVHLFQGGPRMHLESCPFTIDFPDCHTRNFNVKPKADPANHARTGRGYIVTLRGTAPDQVRRRGLVRAVARFKILLERARVAVADPRRPGAQAALAAERATVLAETEPPHWAAKEASEQASRKRKLVDAIHEETFDVQWGARWVNIHVNGESKCNYELWHEGTDKEVRVNLMRVEAVAGDHFVFQKRRLIGDNPYEKFYDTVVLHRDAFRVEEARERLPERVFVDLETSFGYRFCQSRDPTTYEPAPYDV